MGAVIVEPPPLLELPMLPASTWPPPELLEVIPFELPEAVDEPLEESDDPPPLDELVDVVAAIVGDAPSSLPTGSIARSVFESGVGACPIA